MARTARPWIVAAAIALSGLLVADAWAQQGSTATRKANFLCVIDLEGNGLMSSLINPSVYPDGDVFTYDSEKLCTGSATNQNINLTCIAMVEGWRGGNQTLQNVDCTIGIGACGVEGLQLGTAVNSSLKLDSNGRATLSCQYKGGG